MNDCFLFLSVSGWGNKNYKLCYPGLMFKKKKPRGDILRGYMVLLRNVRIKSCKDTIRVMQPNPCVKSP